MKSLENNIDKEFVLFPYESLRPGQKELSEIVRDAVNNGILAVINAPTGFGKTAAVIKGINDSNAEKVLWLVRTVNEIDPIIRELSRFKFSYSFLFSAKRTCPIFGLSDSDEETGLYNEDFWENCRLVRINDKCDYYRKTLSISNEELWNDLNTLELNNSAYNKAHYISNKLGACPFFSLAELSKDVRFIIATYPYFFKEEIFERVLESIDTNKLVVVVDEAHSLMNANSILENKISLRDIENSINELKENGYLNTEVEKIILKLYEIVKNVKPSYDDMVKKIDKKLFEDIIGYTDIISDVADDIRERKFKNALFQTNSIRNIKVSLTRIVSWLNTIKSENTFVFSSTEDRIYRLIAMPLDPASVVSNPLQKARSAILMSGTIPPGDFVNELLNINKNKVVFDSEIMIGSNSKIGDIITVVIGDVTSLYKSRSDTMFKRIAYYLSQINKRINGIKLNVFPSYDIMNKIVSMMDKNTSYLNEGKNTSLSSLINSIKNDYNIGINAVAGGKITEGIEISENGKSKIKAVSIVGIPYPQRDTYFVSREQVLSKRLGITRTKFYLYKITAYIRIKQALGRAIRNPSDKAVYFLIDYRYIYGEIKKLLKLKYNKITKNLQEFNEIMPDVENFINSS
ncbi:MAG: helicase C-terminal domain-containing protein [Caldisphaera sp.]